VPESGFPSHRDAALALLNETSDFSRKAAQFLGQIAADSTPLSQRQASWLGRLLERAGLPPLASEEAE
jgi:hypothetical protein